ncbi:cold shock domain-containing protein [Rhodococcus sp. JS3073]|nr:cold shock domain-containing protein [Rhodococcus sp. JS3073]
MHFSEVEIDGFRALNPGQEVDFEWQKPTGAVEGFAFVATQVRPVQNRLTIPDRTSCLW